MTFAEPPFLKSLRSVANLRERPDPAGTLSIIASITNLREIERAWGVSCALTVRHVVLERARELCQSVPGIAVPTGESILFVFNSPFGGLSPEALASTQFGLLLDRMLADLADQPIEVADGVLFAAVSVSIVENAGGEPDVAALGAGPGVARFDETQQRWRECFISDMEAAQRLFSAKDLNLLVLDAEPVCRLRNDKVEQAVRHYEVVPSWTSQGVRRRVTELVAPLERRGLIRRLDRWTVETTIRALQSNPGLRLGCSVTSRSASLDAWWTSIVATLGVQRAVAQRLVVEISEITPSADMARVDAFVRQLQALGCQVGLSRVGGGSSSVEALALLGVDVVKIDAGRLRDARGNGRAGDFLRNLVTLAGGAGADVVITGVEDEADREIAELAGATHIQGPCFRADVLENINISNPN